MAWIAHRNGIIAVNVLSALLLLNWLTGFGLSLGTRVLGGITVAALVAVGQIYSAIALWKQYI